MKKIKMVFALLLLTGVMGIAAIPSISPAYADEESKCGLCNCYIPMHGTVRAREERGLRGLRMLHRNRVADSWKRDEV